MAFVTQHNELNEKYETTVDNFCQRSLHRSYCVVIPEEDIKPFLGRDPVIRSILAHAKTVINKSESRGQDKEFLDKIASDKRTALTFFQGTSGKFIKIYTNCLFFYFNRSRKVMCVISSY